MKTVQLLCAQSLLTTTDKTLMIWFCCNWIRVPHREQIAKCCWKTSPTDIPFTAWCLATRNLSLYLPYHSEFPNMVTDETSYTTYVLYLQDFTSFYKPQYWTICLPRSCRRPCQRPGSWMGVGGKWKQRDYWPQSPALWVPDGLTDDFDPHFGRWKYTFDHNGRSKEQCESQEADVALAMATELETQVVQDIFQHDPWKHGEKGEKGYKS